MTGKPPSVTKERRAYRREAALHMRMLGYTLAEIATDLGCSPATVRELLQEADERRTPRAKEND